MQCHVGDDLDMDAQALWDIVRNWEEASHNEMDCAKDYMWQQWGQRLQERGVQRDTLLMQTQRQPPVDHIHVRMLARDGDECLEVRLHPDLSCVEVGWSFFDTDV